MAASVGVAALSKAFVGTVPVQKIYVGSAQVWPSAGEEPPYLYGVDIVYKPNYVVEFTVKKGLPYDPNSDEAFMFRCVQMPKDGYTGRTFSKQWSANGYSKLDCTLQDLWGDGNPANNDTMMKTISFQITPRP